MGKAAHGFSDLVKPNPSLRGGLRLYAGLERIARKAKAALHEQFTALAHHLSVEFLEETFSLMNRHGAPGVDRVSMEEYGLRLHEHTADLTDRMKRRARRATGAPGVHTEGGKSRQTSTAWRSCRRRSPASSGGRATAERHLRAGVSGLLVRVSPGPERARCATQGAPDHHGRSGPVRVRGRY